MVTWYVHTLYKYKDNMINVGVDQWEFTPRTLKELLGGIT